MNRSKTIVTSFFIILGIIFLDRFSKLWALGLSDYMPYSNFLSFGLTFNRGINWGLFNSPESHQFITINAIIALVIIGLLWHTIAAYKNQQSIVGYSFILAGAFSNFYDRLFHGGVIDFIILSFRNFVWPAFNCADVFIVTGIGLILFGMWQEK